MPGTEEPWHFDKRIPIALILVILGQTAGAGWWASSLSSRIDVIEKAKVSQDAEDAKRDIALDAIKADIQLKADRVAETQRALSEQIIEQRGDLRAIRELMQRIETRLDAAQSPRRP